MISQWTSIWVFNRHLIFLSPQMFVRFCILVPPAIWSSQLWGDQRAGPALWSPQNPLVPLPWHPRQLIYRTGRPGTLCSTHILRFLVNPALSVTLSVTQDHFCSINATQGENGISCDTTQFDNLTIQ